MVGIVSSELTHAKTCDLKLLVHKNLCFLHAIIDLADNCKFQYVFVSLVLLFLLQMEHIEDHLLLEEVSEIFNKMAHNY